MASTASVLRLGSRYLVADAGANTVVQAEHRGKVTTLAQFGNGLVAGGLFAPYGIALHHGSAYVTTGSVLPEGGEVVQIPLR